MSEPQAAATPPVKNQRTRVGRVVSDRMQKTVTVLIERRVKDPFMGKTVTRSSKYHAHVASGEYKNISFIHEIADSSVEDITADILIEAAVPDIGLTHADLQASHFDHVRDLRKHEAV